MFKRFECQINECINGEDADIQTWIWNFWGWSRTLRNISGKTSCTLVVDINTDIAKLENICTINYITTLSSYRFWSYITVSSQISNFSAKCIYHIFAHPADSKSMKPTNIASGWFFKDITSHLPCFISIKCGNFITNTSRLWTRLINDKNVNVLLNACKQKTGKHFIHPM